MMISPMLILLEKTLHKCVVKELEMSVKTTIIILVAVIVIIIIIVVVIVTIMMMIHLCRAGFVEDSRDPGKRLDRWVHISLQKYIHKYLFIEIYLCKNIFPTICS